MARKLKVFSQKEVSKKLESLSAWQVNKSGTQLARVFTTSNFVAGLAFVAKITVHAEILEHHPDIELSYKKVKVKLTTHDKGGLTKLDFKLAKKIDNIRVV